MNLKFVKIFVGSIVGIIALWLIASLYLSGQAATLVFLNKVSWASVPESPQLSYKLNWKQNSAKQNFSIWELQAQTSTDQYLIYLHGNAGRLLHFFPELTKKFNVISPAYPGYSESEGDPNVENVYETAVSTYDWLTAKGVNPNKITILGHSMGGSPAVYLASKKPAKQLVVINTFSSIQSMCIRQYGPLCVFTGSIFNSAENSRNVTIPVRQFAYRGDTTIPFDEGELLFKEFKSGDKKFFEMNGFTHSYPNFEEILKNISVQ
jgi:uncharacterized protein